MPRTRAMTVLVVPAVLAVVLVLLLAHGRVASPLRPPSTGAAPGMTDDLLGVSFSASGWATDFTRHTIALGEIEPGGPGKDGIPAIDHPQFVSAGEADSFLAIDEPVLVVRGGQEARAYPLQILLWHEIVNDTVAGEPVVVTYCPLCNSALAFRRTFDGRVLDFGTTGNLRNSDLVMYDRQTESWWQQITGEGIVGRFAGRGLEMLPVSIIAYADFKAAFPNGRVLSRQTGYSRPYGTSPYGGYDTGEPFLFKGRTDERLPATERVVAVTLGNESVTYPFGVLERERVINDVLGGTPIVVFFKPGTRSALDAEAIKDSRAVGAGVVFVRSTGGRVLTFRPDADGAADAETGSHWDITGRAERGPLAGTQLEPVVHGNDFWFAWAVFMPRTRVYDGR